MTISKERDLGSNRKNKRILRPGTLWSKLQSRSEQAKNRGALRRLTTRCELIAHERVQFLVRIMEDCKPGNRHKTAMHDDPENASNFVNPFLPYDTDLFVTDISDSHIAILNKFNIVDHHLLLITRSFEPQYSLLTLRDFQAAWTCLEEFDGLVFYNSDPVSGSSQPHKHLQLIPLPMVPSGLRVPTEALITAGLDHDLIARSPDLPFAHSVTRITTSSPNSMHNAARDSLERYLNMIRATDLHSKTVEDTQTSDPYNLLITRRWMLLVPRRKECFESICVNALGFAGALLVRNSRQLQALKRAGPMRVLQHVAKPE